MTGPGGGGADEIREQLARSLYVKYCYGDEWMWDNLGPDHPPRRRAYADADALLSGPLAPLLALRQHVWDLAEEGGHEGWISARHLYAALDGTP